MNAELSAHAEKELTSASFATLSLLRIAAVAAGFTWLAFLFFHTLPQLLSEPGQPPPWGIDVIGFALLAIAGFIVTISALVHRPEVYKATFRGATVIYLALVAVHTFTSVLPGDTVFHTLRLGEYVGVPMVLFLCTTSPAIGVPIAIAVTTLTSYFSDSPHLEWWKLTTIVHAVLQVLPFYVLTSAAIFNGLRLDALAARAHREASAVARLLSLREMELRFMAFVHDVVLNKLRSVSSGAQSVRPESINISNIGDETSGPPLQLPVADIVLTMVATVQDVAPDTEFEFPEFIPYELTLKADVAAVLIDALREASINSSKHAPQAKKTCTIDAQWRDNELLELQASLVDDGPGFDPSLPHIGHAGVRVTILERTRATRGCKAALHTRPGKGTSVSVTWSATHEQEEDPSDLSGVDIPDTFELVGMSMVFGWWYVPIGMFYALLMLLTADPFHRSAGSLAWWCVVVVATFIALLAIRRGRAVQLPLPSTLVATAAIAVYIAAAALAAIPPRLDPWPDVWYMPFFVVLIAGLAMRQRGWFATAVLAFAVAVEFLAAGNQPHPIPPGLFIALSSLLLIPAVLIPHMARRISRALPYALSTRRRESITVASVAAKRGFIADSTQWLQNQLDELASPERSRPPAREFARLLEKRLRDSIRSPMFDVPEITDAVWRARARGVEVHLLDDLSPAIYDVGGSESPALAAARVSFQDVVKDELDSLPSGTFTARLFPPGRDILASIVIAANDDNPAPSRTRRMEFPSPTSVPVCT